MRLQRLRTSQAWREMLEETTLQVQDLIMPVFIHEGLQQPQEISAMPGISQQSFSSLLTEIESIAATGIKAIILFGIPLKKDSHASEAFNPNGVVQRAIQEIKSIFPELIIIADCCLCEYTDNGHCALSDPAKTLLTLQKIAVSYAHSGVDIIAPSGMLDGMVSAIRHGLDSEGFHRISIMSYAVKYASAFYGPFREAAGSLDTFKGNRKHHQMNPAQRREALREAELDCAEGADILMVKPATLYLDIVRDLRNRFDHPLAVYHVSGEYAMLKAAAQRGWIDEMPAIQETLLSMKRAGAHMIITYFAKQIAPFL